MPRRGKMNWNTIKLWLLTKPLPRSGIPAIIGALLGLLTNLIAACVFKSGEIQWSVLPQIPTVWVAVVLLATGILYQKKVYDYDNRALSVLDESKQELAGSITQFYAAKIDQGQIDELQEADQKLRQIFQRDQ